VELRRHYVDRHLKRDISLPSSLAVFLSPSLALLCVRACVRVCLFLCVYDENWENTIHNQCSQRHTNT
jgi:hypothetical protein